MAESVRVRVARVRLQRSKGRVVVEAPPYVFEVFDWEAGKRMRPGMFVTVHLHDSREAAEAAAGEGTLVRSWMETDG